jgi:hypothetical protein
VATADNTTAVAPGAGGPSLEGVHMAQARKWLTCSVSMCLLSSCIVVDPTGGGGQPPKVYCVKDRASGACYCSTSDPGLGDDTDYVASCDSLPTDTQCCHDLNGDGETTYCSCLRALCATDTDTDNCVCTYFGGLVVGNSRDNETVVTTCPTTACCRGSESCSCFNGSANCFSDTPVSSCTVSSIPAKLSCSGGTRWAASCAGLKWTK